MRSNEKVCVGIRLDPEEWDEEGVTKLRIAIVKAATEDWVRYTKALGRLREGTNEYRYREAQLVSVERFLKSPWCEYLGGISGEYLIERLRKEMPRKNKKTV